MRCKKINDKAKYFVNKKPRGGGFHLPWFFSFFKLNYLSGLDNIYKINL